MKTALLWLALLAIPAAASAQVSASAVATAPSVQADRASILAMAGNYSVRFDLRETTPWRADYTPIPAAVLSGTEAVRVIEDAGTLIRLQHLLVIDTGDGKPVVVKHWRQDWQYEPARVLVYAGPNHWVWQDVPAAERAGAWSQTVYQVDDSPRYAGWGRWAEVGGVRFWQSNRSWRPLARRDAVRHPVYDRYLGVNRHALSPAGWVHWQDNTKMATIGGRLMPVVQETVLNSYTRSSTFPAKAADDYWAATKGYWAAIRAEWARIADARGGIRVTEEPDHGSAVASRLLDLADEVQAGKTAEAKAITTAKTLIGQAIAAAGG